MKNRSLAKVVFLSLLLGNLLPSSAFSNGLTPEQVLNKELLLNQLMTSIHLLQLDFHNEPAREQLQERLELINSMVENLPENPQDSESAELLNNIQVLWPIISRHTLWLAELPEQSQPPELNSLMRALAKLDRQLLLIRQKNLTANPQARRTLRFLEHALLMQRMTREYLSLTLSHKEAKNTLSGQMQLQSLADHFEQTLARMIKDLKHHPHASTPLKATQASWQYISRSITRFPEQNVPGMVVYYNDRIVDKLFSVQRMQ